MQRKGSKKLSRNLALLAAVSAAATSVVGMAQTLLTAPSFNGLEPHRTTSFSGGSFVDVYNANETSSSWAAFDFATNNLLTSSQEVTAVNNDMTLNLFDSSFSGNASTGTALNFYLVTDTTTSITSGVSTLRWVTNAPNGDGIANPGSSTNAFAAGTTNYLLGTNAYSYTKSGTTGTLEQFIFSLNSTEEGYIENQINEGNAVRIAIGNPNASTVVQAASFLGFSATTSPINEIPQLVFDTTVGSTSGSPNGSQLQLIGPGVTDGKDNTGTPFNFGRIIQNITVTSTAFSLANTNANANNTLLYRNIPTGSPMDASAPGTDPLAASSNSKVTIGYSAADTNGSAGFDVPGQVEYENISNSNDPAVFINATAHVVANRLVDSASPTGGTSPNVGEVLVGFTKTQAVTMFTTNPVSDNSGTDYTSNALTTQTFVANGAGTAFNQTESFNGTSITVATVSGNFANFNQTFTNAGVGTAFFTVAVTHSGSYGVWNAGATNSFTVGTTTISVGNQYTQVSSGATTIIGEGLVGESDAARIYGQWQGVQSGAISNASGGPVSPGNNVSIGNAASNDAVFTRVLSGVTNYYNYGIRATARVDSITFNQNSGWGQSGFVGGGQGVGTTIVAPSYSANSTSPENGTNTQSAALSFSPQANDLNGTYSANMQVLMENDAQYNAITNTGIFGTSAGDLGTLAIPVANGSVSQPSGLGATGPYSLNGGGYVSATGQILSGSYNQTGGISTFVSLTGSGSITMSGGSMTMTGTPNFLGTLANGTSLTMAGTGTVQQITGNGTVTVNSGASLTTDFSASSLVNNGTFTLVSGGSNNPSTVGTISGTGGLVINSGATLKLAAVANPFTSPHTVNTQNSLTIQGSGSNMGTLDLTTNSLVINYGGNGGSYNPAFEGAVRSEIVNAFDGGNWDGHGITSSTAEADAASGGTDIYQGNAAVGYADNNFLGNPSIPTNSVLVRFTLYGDADLNGVVNLDDFNDWLAGFSDPTDNPDNWVDGDFLYEGNVNLDDFTAWLASFQANEGSLGSLVHDIEVSTLSTGQQQQLLSLVNAVPEPASIGILGFAAAGLMTRRRKRRAT